MLVYLLTIIITASWLLKMLAAKKLIFNRTPLDIPLILFLIANILSTIFSIDQHTSVWGYYSRANGGLLSTISYLLLYYALVSNFEINQAIKFLKSAVFGGVLVALYAIPEHFGVSPSCLILTGELNASCWVQDVVTRVFATLGQPNWLAAYLSILIFPSVYLFLQAKTKIQSIFYLFAIGVFYIALVFTKSRSGALAFFGGLALFLGLLILPYLNKKFINNFKINTLIKESSFIKVGQVLGIILVLTLIYGSALFNRFEGINTAFQKTDVSAPPPTSSQTQLEVEGGETPKIRLIVWQGAIDVFKHYPVFGSGVETFAYSYYNFRPAAHNLTSEWDFLYNKAHNEFLNYLATTGIFGFLSYLAVIFTFFVWGIRKHQNLIIPTLLASYLAYHIQNFFGFSVVIVALLFYLLPAFAFIVTESTKPLELPKGFLNLNSLFINLLYRRPINTKFAKGIIFISLALLIFKLVSLYQADILYAAGLRANEAGNPGKAYNNLTKAVSLNPGEPLYRSELGFAAATASVVLEDEDATTAGELKAEAIVETNQALKISPKNLSILRTAIRTYYSLAATDKKYTAKTLEAVDQAVALAPTDVKLLYNKAVILNQEGKKEEIIPVLEKTVALKPNYKEAILALGIAYFNNGEKDKGIQTVQSILKFAPNDPAATEQLKKWQP